MRSETGPCVVYCEYKIARRVNDPKEILQGGRTANILPRISFPGYFGLCKVMNGRRMKSVLEKATLRTIYGVRLLKGLSFPCSLNEDDSIIPEFE
jgi:hypothetical protein